jgi:hypothetical protein
VIAYFADFEDLWWLLSDAQQRRLLTFRPEAFDGDTSAWGLGLAQVYHARGDDRRSRAYADTSVRAFEVKCAPGPCATLRGARSCVAMNEDEYFEPYLKQQLARIYILAGQPDKAIETLAPLLHVPHTLSPGWLRIDPTWDPLRSHPRFKQLIEGTA